MKHLKLPLEKRRYFIVGDIHGRFGYFHQLLRKVGFCDDDIVISVGDMIDRGVESYRVVKWFHDTSNAYAVRGNHESMFLDAANLPDIPSTGMYASGGFDRRKFWIRNGGETTMNEIDQIDDYTEDKLKDMCEALPYVITVGEQDDPLAFRVLHSDPPLQWDEDDWLNIDNLQCGQKELETLLWSRALRTLLQHTTDEEGFAEMMTMELPFRTFVGHTPTYGKVERVGPVTWCDTGGRYLSMVEAISGKVHFIEGLGCYQ